MKNISLSHICFVAFVITSIMGCVAIDTADKTPHVHTAPEPELERQALKYPDALYLEGLGEQQRIALTFDDGPGEYTEDLLEVLAKHEVKATFFWTGEQIKKHPEVVKAAAARGHTIGNHTVSHPHSRELNIEQFWSDQVAPTQQLIEATTGATPALFRPPYGEITDAQIEFLDHQKGMTIIGWSIDPKDWSMSNEPGAPGAIIQTVQAYAHPEAIVLMHDGIFGYPPNTIQAIDELIPWLKNRGYKFATIDELLRLSPTLQN